MKLSIVATMYQSAPYIVEFCERATTVARELVGADYELILVNDGSPDESLAVAVELSTHDGHISVVDLSRNFGHHKAMMTGLRHAQGEQTFLIDIDLEEEPEWLINFAHHQQENSCDVVYGVQTQRKGGSFERWSGELFYRLTALFLRVNLPRNVVTARLMSKRYVDALLSHQEREVFMAGLWQQTGFDQQPYVVEKHDTSETTYTLRRKVSLLVGSVTSFSNVPLVGIFYLGLGISTLAGLYTAYLVINWAFLEKPLSGWTSVMASIWLLGGLIVSLLGVVGIYLSKIFMEVKNRPYTIVRQVYGQRKR